ncbi:metalloregulator ArsR/SmtB family transcription factor [Caulobacter segnis]|uniref:ArsR/SmtB family transcription factor n=1 Tax=Caulobacter segnis TaxID=88688 RepID=UPI0024107F93|nr:metalloregulator ArsR/SmtB family transcription factor [Caulobacter segnis]MDG2522949.1 metalloregulator ArsR/SmtB family transcription factor [Caulobacter segnis]
MNEDQAAAGLAALGSPVRLRIFRLLVRAGLDGASVSDIVRLMDMPASTLGHHLGALAKAELVLQQKRGRELICTANFGRVTALQSFLTEACCTGLAAADCAA